MPLVWDEKYVMGEYTQLIIAALNNGDRQEAIYWLTEALDEERKFIKTQKHLQAVEVQTLIDVDELAQDFAKERTGEILDREMLPSRDKIHLVSSYEFDAIANEI